MDIFERKYPQCKALFIFDNAPSHMKKPDDAINTDVMNVNTFTGEYVWSTYKIFFLNCY